MFGLLIAATELLFVFAGKRPLRIAPLLIGALSLAYPVLYRLLLPSMWGCLSAARHRYDVTTRYHERTVYHAGDD